MPDVICCDLDDFSDDEAPWALPLLDQLYAESSGHFRATLFTIPARTSSGTLRQVASRPWLELAVHGWEHQGPECADWTLERTQETLHAALWTGRDWDPPHRVYHSVFKAPYWIAHPAVYVALAQAGWTVADHPRNALTIPPGLRRYVLSSDHRIGQPHLVLPVIQAHGHFTSEGVDNGLREHLADFRALAQLNLPYKWVSEVAT